ncbi:MAG: 16S rRNA (guanine(966)-N(2))-methyltransferase RsmD [Clostridiales bacterium]|nr:16S rRNA (guanine(966)-N(2))-methyltransferase RsmD [Clostridiales bacterium]
MRIIGGEYGSRRLITPRGAHTRPTLDRTRESLFNVLQGRVDGAAVLDLFSGSGALGLEALSRGARTAVFCDDSREAAQAIRANLTALGAQHRARLLHMDWSRAVDLLAGEGERFNLIFLDPPYQMRYEPVLNNISAAGLLAPDGWLMLERDSGMQVTMPDGLEVFRTKDYRATSIDFVRYRQEVADENSGISGQL